MRKPLMPLALLTLAILQGCGNDRDRNLNTPIEGLPPSVPDNAEISHIIPDNRIFETEEIYRAEIKRTDYGVPHIKAHNLESAAFGSGYTQAQDNLCLLADEFVRVNSMRSAIHGPDVLFPGDNLNLMTDFTFKALKLKEKATENFDDLSDESKALLKGYAAGYNLYINAAKAGEQPLPDQCGEAPWLTHITPEDVLTYIYANAITNGIGGTLFALAYANPGDGEEWQPRVVGFPMPGGQAAPQKAKSKSPQATSPIKFTAPTGIFDKEIQGFGSNAWGIGKEMSENGKGILLANPHYPHSGAFRFWQSHIEIPEVMNVAGASLLGMPGVINIGFNNDIAWTHTLSGAEQFVLYQLTISPENRMIYMMDGVNHAINVETVTVNVKVDGQVVTMAKDYYSTEQGLIIEAEGILPWDNTQAFVIKDANLYNNDVLDQWLAMNVASNINTFSSAFERFDGIAYSNTVYADKTGTTAYFDDTNVPNLAPPVVDMIKNDPLLSGIRDQFGVTVVPAFSSALFHMGAVPYEQIPRIVRQDYVQNSNDTHWATNLNAKLEGFSPLYGKERSPLSWRTRMGLKMLDDSRGDDNKFNSQEVESALFSNRVYFGETIIPSVISQCTAVGDTPIPVTADFSMSIAPGCDALRQWNGSQNLDTIGGHLVRELAAVAAQVDHLEVPFDPENPANTPNTLKTDGTALVGLAIAMLNVQNSGWPMDATIGQMQFVENVNSDGTEQRPRLPWAGTHDVEGGFNTFNNYYALDVSSFQKRQYLELNDVLTGQPLASGLSPQGYQVSFGSSWMMIVGFDENGPVARGLLTHSQSTLPTSTHYDDQTEYYSANNQLRPILFSEEQISNHTLSSETIVMARPEEDEEE